MSIQSFVTTFFGHDPFTDNKGALTLNGSKFLLALWNRTGDGTGIVPKVSPPLTATGSTINDALQLNKDWNLVTSVPSGSGVLILPLKPGNDIQVVNAGGAGNLNVYPPSSGIQIDGLGNGAPYSLAAGKLRIFECLTATQFYSYGS